MLMCKSHRFTWPTTVTSGSITAHASYHSNTDHGDNYMCASLLQLVRKRAVLQRLHTFHRILYNAFVASARFGSGSLMHRVNVSGEARMALFSSLSRYQRSKSFEQRVTGESAIEVRQLAGAVHRLALEGFAERCVRTCILHSTSKRK